MKSDQVGSNIIFRESQKYIDNKISSLLIEEEEEEEEDIEKRNTRCPQIRIYELSLPFWEGREERDKTIRIKRPLPCPGLSGNPPEINFPIDRYRQGQALPK